MDGNVWENPHLFNPKIERCRKTLLFLYCELIRAARREHEKLYDTKPRMHSVIDEEMDWEPKVKA